MRLFHETDAVFSPCAKHIEENCERACKERPYRYTLHRKFPLHTAGAERPILFIMLNPSTATHLAPDPTITRLIGFATQWRYTELVVCNLFAWRSTDPKVLPRLEDPVGPDNDEHITQQAARADQVVVAWGNHGHLHRRDLAVLDILKRLNVKPWCFKVTKAAAPEHPLYQKNSSVLIPFEIL